MRRFKGRSARRWPRPSTAARSSDLDNGEQSPSLRARPVRAAVRTSRQGRRVGAGLPGNDQFSTGDQINRPLGGGGGGQGKGKASKDGEGTRTTSSSSSRARSSSTSSSRTSNSPAWSSTQLARITDYKTSAPASPQRRHAGQHQHRALDARCARARLALGSPYHRRMRELQQELDEALARTPRTARKCAPARARSPSCAPSIEASPSSTPSTCATTTASRCPSRPPRP
jgi:uncharacterized sporulation protein YeaH/YhbH (DUF444 family)